MLPSDLPTLDELEAALRPIPHRASPKVDRQVKKEILFRLAKQKLRIENEGLNLYMELPMGSEFHATNCFARVADGSNRSSKTTTVVVEFSRAVTASDPHDKYLTTNGSALVVGLDSDHLSMLWSKASEPGAFKIIQDEVTQRWRSVRPDPNNPLLLDPYDLAYAEKWRDAPPLIPAA